MNCHEVSDCLSDYLNGELSADRAEGVRAHLVTCPACTRELREFQEIGCALAVTEIRALPRWVELESRLTEKIIGSAQVHRNPWSKSVAILAMAASLVVAFLVIRYDNRSLRVESGVALNAYSLDYSKLLNKGSSFEAELESLARSHHGQLATSSDVEQLLGYRPASLDQFPSGDHLVSRRM
jgi:hypothetical protein